MEDSVFLWGWDTANWKKVRVDAAGHLQVDVITAGGTASHCMGWDGGEWLPMLFEADDVQNLRVKLYDGANGIDSNLLNTGSLDVSAKRGLYTQGQVLLQISATHAIEWTGAGFTGDGGTGYSLGSVGLYGFNGATFDRLRVDADKNLKVADSFGGNIYSKTMTMADNDPTRFEAASKKLRDIVIIVKTHSMLLGETGVVVYPVGAGETVGFTKVDISTLWFQNAIADSNGVITILGVEE